MDTNKEIIYMANIGLICSLDSGKQTTPEFVVKVCWELILVIRYNYYVYTDQSIDSNQCYIFLPLILINSINKL